MQYLMVDTFPKTFSQAATSRWYFHKWNLSNCAISQAATSQVYSFLSNRLLSFFLATVFGSQCSQRRPKWPNPTFRKFPLRKLHIWEVATWEIGTWEVAFWKFPLGKLLKPLFLFTLIFSKIYNKF